ncbi:hypothetical protein M8494_22785 [Serratia ureilytica]
MVLDETPFYGESGGVGLTKGVLKAAGAELHGQRYPEMRSPGYRPSGQTGAGGVR